ncbi:hypothetical protein R84B8_02316 [Treponema sp. R8-4-B8]
MPLFIIQIPKTLNQLRHDIVLTSATGKLEFSFTGTTFEAYIAPGKWNVSVYSWLGDDIYAVGSEDVILKSGQDNREKIKMYQAHMVKFNSDGGSNVPDQIVRHGFPAKKPDHNPTNPNSTLNFGGWYYGTDDERQLFDFDDVEINKITKDITLYAYWSEDYFVTFHSNGGIFKEGSSIHTSIQKQVVKGGRLTDLPPNPTRRSYEFTKWTLGLNGPEFNLNSVINSNIDLYAAWGDFITEARGSTLTDKLNWLYDNAIVAGNYTVTITDTQNLNSESLLSYKDDYDHAIENVKITLTGKGTVQLGSSATSYGWIKIDSGVTLTLESITLKGFTTNVNPAVYVSGTLIMNSLEAAITDNTNNSATEMTGGGVYVANGGNFTMNNGNITNNSADNGGGIVVSNGGQFTMNGGTINLNNADSGLGGGVYVNGGTFNMSSSGSAELYHNTAKYGGSVYVANGGIFTMSGGEIKENTATYAGGGVCVANGGIFNKTSGTIYGYISTNNKSNKVENNNQILEKKGHAACVLDQNNGVPLWKDSDVVTTAPLAYNGSTTPPTYSGGWDEEQLTPITIIVSIGDINGATDSEPLKNEPVYVDINDSAELTVIGHSADFGYTFAWYIGGSLQTEVTTSSYTFTAETAGIYDITVVVKDNSLDWEWSVSGSCTIIVR